MIVFMVMNENFGFQNLTLAVLLTQQVPDPVMSPILLFVE